MQLFLLDTKTERTVESGNTAVWLLTLSFIYTDFNTLKKKKKIRKIWKKMKLLKMSNFTFFHIVFYAICVSESLNSHISVVVCSFVKFGTVSEWCIREWVNKVLCVRVITKWRSLGKGFRKCT